METSANYTWLFGLGLVLAFADAYGIGSNDVSNSFSTSVGSGSITLLQACTIAVFTEFFGAVLLGSNTTKTISGIVNNDLFEYNPSLLMLAMCCSLIGSSVWTICASRMGLSVSCTHAVIGAMCGAVLISFGPEAINWSFSSGIGKIVASWVAAPFVSGVVAVVLFLSTRNYVLIHHNSFERAQKAVPWYFALAFFINTFLIVSESGFFKRLELSLFTKTGCSLLIASVSFGFTKFNFVPWMVRNIENNEDLKFHHMFYISQVPTQPIRKLKIKQIEANNTFVDKLKGYMLRGVNKDIREGKDSEHVDKVHGAAEIFDSKTEEMYSYLQVFTAICASIAHGSNDVSNAIGPLSTIYYVYKNNKVPDEVPVPMELLVFGGIAIDIGLFTLGYAVISSLGHKITLLSPSRGFCSEMATSLTVVVASSMGIPLSTTHCITGAMTCIGLCNGTWRAINWKMLGKTFFSWVVTLPMAGLISGSAFYFAAYSPKL
eukprot:NODE_298_length_11435_cov_0.210303.p2 type:complete len:489 gc:universal NODE_298_length_11435_cov_0.210303:5912-7378(+)